MQANDTFRMNFKFQIFKISFSKAKCFSNQHNIPFFIQPFENVKRERESCGSSSVRHFNKDLFDFPYKSLILATPSDACGERLITAPMLHSFSIYFYLNRRRDKRSWKPLRMDRGYRNGTPSIMAWFAFIPSVYMLVFRFHITW